MIVPICNDNILFVIIQANDKKIQVVVTGGSGCLGQEIVNQLIASGNYVVHSLDLFIPPPEKRTLGVVTYIQADVTNSEDILRALQGMDVVFHTANLLPTLIRNNAQAMQWVNVQGTKNVVKACIECNVKRLIYTSSCTICLSRDPAIKYEDVDEFFPLPTNPLNAYVATKGAAEVMVRNANGNESGLKTCSLRLGGLLGGTNNQTMRSLMSPEVRRIGDGNMVLAWTTTKAAAHVHILADKYLEKQPVCSESMNVFNVISMNTIYREINRFYSLENTGKEPRQVSIRLLSALGLINETVYSFSGVAPLGDALCLSIVDFFIPFSFSKKRTENELGWVENRHWEEVVRETIEEYRSNL